MKRFETKVGDQWFIYVVNDTVKITKKGRIVTVVQAETSAGTVKTDFNLAQLPFYTYA